MQGSYSLCHETAGVSVLTRLLAACAAIPLCIGMAIWDLSHAHEHAHEGPQYPYMHIRTKDYPWGPCTLFDGHCWEEAKGGHEEEE